MATLVYDGECDFCKRCVQWVQARDRGGTTFVAHQRASLSPALAERAKTTIIWMSKRNNFESSAAVRALCSLHVGWKVTGAALWLIPKPLRDMGYRWVGRRWGPLKK